jgi:hypothetical protein
MAGEIGRTEGGQYLGQAGRGHGALAGHQQLKR